MAGKEVTIDAESNYAGNGEKSAGDGGKSAGDGGKSVDNVRESFS